MNALCRFGSFSRQHRRIKTTVIQSGPDLVARACCFTCINNKLLDVVEDGEVIAHIVEGQRLIAVGFFACWTHVVFRTGPPDADELIHRIADVRGLLDGDLIHHAPTVHDHVVRLFTTDLQPLGFLFLTGVVNGQQRKFEPVLFAKLFQRADRLFAVGRVVIDQRDLLTLKAATVQIQQVLDRDRCAVPVVRGVIKDVAKDRPVFGRCAAIAHRVDRNAVCRRFRDQLVGDASRQRLIDQRAFALGAFIAFHTFFGVIAGFAFDHPDRFSTDAAVTFVQQRKIIRITVGKRNAIRRIGARAIAERREYKLCHCGARSQSSA